MICVVTGAGGGTGPAIVDILFEKSKSVVAVLRGNEESWQETGEHFLIKADMSDAVTVSKLAEEVCRRLGTFHVWVNVVGGFSMGPTVEEAPAKEWEKMWQLNFMTALNGCKAALPVMKEQKFGRIINFGSLAGLDGMVQAGPYAASKAAVINLSKSVALEYADYHITSNVIVPDIIDTPANRTAMPEADFLQWTSPEEIAKTMVKIIESEQTNEIVRV